jgi:predicted glutamine amidotransferase
VSPGEGAYQIESSAAGGTLVVLVASEPITQSSGDWVAVPKNTALVVSREKEGYIDIVRTPLHPSGEHNRQEEVKM